MSNGKHTPGPWKVGQSGNTICDMGPAPHDRFCIAELGGIYGEKEANAKLIAAAPDMAGALKALLFAQQHLISQFDDADLDAVDKARAALAKAGVQ